MANTPVFPVRLSGWTDGVNLEADDATITATELSEGLNIDIGLNGELSKRKGYAAYSVSHHADLGPGEFVFFYNQLGSASDYLIMVDADGDVFASTSSTFSSAKVHDFGAATGADDYPVGFAIYDNIVYLTSKRNANAVKFDGTTWTEVTDYLLDGGGSHFPRAKFLLTKHERVFAANINNNGTQERSRLRWSNTGDSDTWAATAWIDVDPDDGSEITGIASFADGIVIFKENSMFFLSGVDANTFTLFPVDSTIGTSSPGSIAVTASAVFFLDRKGVYKFDGTEVTRISDKVNTALLADVSFANRHYTNGFFFKDKYYLCIHNGTSVNATWVFDVRNESWVKWSNGFYGAVDKEGTMYVTGPVDTANDDSGRGIFAWLSGETDNSVNYTARFRTGWTGAQEAPFQSRRFKIRYVDIVAEEGAGTLTVNVYEDFNNTANGGTADLDRAGYDHVHRRVNFVPALQSSRTSFQVECSMTSGTNTFRVPAIEVLISPRQKQRGGSI